MSQDSLTNVWLVRSGSSTSSNDEREIQRTLSNNELLGRHLSRIGLSRQSFRKSHSSSVISSEDGSTSLQMQSRLMQTCVKYVTRIFGAFNENGTPIVAFKDHLVNLWNQYSQNVVLNESTNDGMLQEKRRFALFATQQLMSGPHGVYFSTRKRKLVDDYYRMFQARRMLSKAHSGSQGMPLTLQNLSRMSRDALCMIAMMLAVHDRNTFSGGVSPNHPIISGIQECLEWLGFNREHARFIPQFIRLVLHINDEVALLHVAAILFASQHWDHSLRMDLAMRTGDQPLILERNPGFPSWVVHSGSVLFMEYASYLLSVVSIGQMKDGLVEDVVHFSRLLAREYIDHLSIPTTSPLALSIVVRLTMDVFAMTLLHSFSKTTLENLARTGVLLETQLRSVFVQKYLSNHSASSASREGLPLALRLTNARLDDCMMSTNGLSIQLMNCEKVFVEWIGNHAHILDPISAGNSTIRSCDQQSRLASRLMQAQEFHRKMLGETTLRNAVGIAKYAEKWHTAYGVNKTLMELVIFECLQTHWQGTTFLFDNVHGRTIAASSFFDSLVQRGPVQFSNEMIRHLEYQASIIHRDGRLTFYTTCLYLIMYLQLDRSSNISRQAGQLGDLDIKLYVPESSIDHFYLMMKILSLSLVTNTDSLEHAQYRKSHAMHFNCHNVVSQFKLLQLSSEVCENIEEILHFFKGPFGSVSLRLIHVLVCLLEGHTWIEAAHSEYDRVAPILRRTLSRQASCNSMMIKSTRKVTFLMRFLHQILGVQFSLRMMLDQFRFLGVAQKVVNLVEDVWTPSSNSSPTLPLNVLLVAHTIDQYVLLEQKYGDTQGNQLICEIQEVLDEVARQQS